MREEFGKMHMHLFKHLQQDVANEIETQLYKMKYDLNDIANVGQQSESAQLSQKLKSAEAEAQELRAEVKQLKKQIHCTDEEAAQHGCKSSAKKAEMGALLLRSLLAVEAPSTGTHSNVPSPVCAKTHSSYGNTQLDVKKDAGELNNKAMVQDGHGIRPIVQDDDELEDII